MKNYILLGLVGYQHNASCMRDLVRLRRYDAENAKAAADAFINEGLEDYDFESAQDASENGCTLEVVFVGTGDLVVEFAPGDLPDELATHDAAATTEG